jgi:hypothetical protein
MATARLPGSGWSRLSPRSYRRRIAGLALWLLAATLLSAHLTAGSGNGLRGPVADSLNMAIAWSDLNLGLAPRLGAHRAVQLDPTLGTGLGRQGARWLARNGTVSERLRWAGALARRDPAERPLLRRAANAARCSDNPKLRAAARAALIKAGLRPPRNATKGRPC